MATGVHIQEPVLDTLRREDENEKMMDQGSYITLGKVPVEVNLGAGHTPIEPQDTLETDFDVKDSVEGSEGSASTIEGEKFFKSPSAAEVYFEENNLSPDACRVTENAEKMATLHDDSHVGGAKLDADESNGMEKGLVSALEVGSMRDVGQDESKPVHEAGLSGNREDRVSKVPEEEAAHMESLNVNPEDSKTCVTSHGTETTSSIEEKSMTSTPQVIPDDKIEQTKFETSDETPENVSTVVPNEETEQHSGIKVDDSQMKTDENLEKEDEKPESTLIPEGQIKDDESTQNELFGSKDDTERMIQESEEVIEKRVESSQVATSEAEGIKATTSDHDGETSALENQIPTENPLEIEGGKSECKTEKETPEEQDVSTLASVSGEDDTQGEREAHMEKENEKQCSTDASTRDASHDEMMPVDKTRTEDEEPSKSDLLETKDDKESTILVEEPIMEKHLESLNATPDDVKACDSVEDTETKSSIEEKLLTATPQEISGDKIEKTAFDTKEETPEDISKVVSSEETEQNSIAEVPFVTEALTIDNELAITEGKIKDEDRREEDLLENKNDTESELLKQEEVMEKPVESSKLADEAEDIIVSTSDHDTQTSAFENQILTENPQDIVGDETESKIVDTKNVTLDVQKDASTIESNDDNDENSVIEEDEIGKPFLREESTRDATGDESTYTHKDKIEGEDQRSAELFNNPSGAESTPLIEEATIMKLVESPQVEDEEIKTHVSDQDAEKTGLVSAFEGKSNDGDSAVKDEVKTEDNDQKEDELCDNTEVSVSDHYTKTSALENQILTENPKEIVGDETESKTCDVVDTKKETTLDVEEVSKIKSNDDNEENSMIEDDEGEKLLLREESTRNTAGDESTYTHKDKIEGKNERRAELFENPSGAESTPLIEEATITKLVESPQVDAEEIKTHVSDQDAEKTGLVSAFEGKSNDGDSAVKDEVKTEDNDQKENESCDNDAEDTEVSASAHYTKTSALENQILTENPKEIVGDETESKTCDVVDTKKETTLDVQDVSKIKSNDDNEENSKIEDDESEKLLLREESTRNTAGDESTYTHKDKIEGKNERRAELFENQSSAESTSLIEEATIPKVVESPPVDPENIKTHVSDQDEEETGLVSAFEGKSNDGDSAVKDEVKTEDNDQKENELCDNEVEDTEVSTSDYDTKTIALENQILTENPKEIVGDETESKTCDVVDTKKETLDVQDVSKIKSNDDNEENSMIEDDESEKLLLREESTRNTAGDESTYTLKDKIEGKNERRAELFENQSSAESTSLIEEATIPKVVESPPVDPENIKTHVSDQDEEETGLVSAFEGKSSHGDSAVKDEVKTEDNDQREDELCDNDAEDTKVSTSDHDTKTSALENPQETVGDETESKTCDVVDKNMGTLDVQDVSTIESDDDNKENLVIEEDEREKPLVREESTRDAAGDESTYTHEGKTEGKDQRRAELSENPRSAESTSLIEEATIQKFVESPQVDAEVIKAHVSDQDAEKPGLVLAFEGKSNDGEYAVKYEYKSADDDQKEDELCDNEKNPEGSVILEAAQTETTIESSQETLPITVPRGFLDDKTDEKTADAIQKDKDIQIVTTVSNEKIEENSLIPMDGSQTQHEEKLEKEHEIPSVIGASTKHANDDELIIINEDNLEHEDLRKVEMLESEKDTEINLQKNEAQIETHIKSLQLAAKDIVASGSYQETETKNSQEEPILNEDEIVHEQTEVKKLDTADTMRETPEALDVSTIVLNDNEENPVIGEDDSQTKNEENLGKESEKPPFIEVSRTDASGDESAGEDKIEGEEQMRAELFEDKKATESTLLKEGETVAQPLESPQVDAEDIETYVSDQVTETTGLVEVFKGLPNDEEPEIKCTIKTEDKDKKEDELCDTEKIPDSTSLPEATEMEKPFESLKEALPTLVPRGFLEEKTGEKTVDANEKDEETHETQNVATIVSNENVEDDSLLEVGGSQMQRKEYSEEESEFLPIVEASTVNANDDNSIKVHEESIEHEGLRKDEMAESKDDTKITSQKEEPQVETPVKSLNVAADDIIASGSCTETESSSQEERILNKEKMVCEQIEVETLDRKTKTPEAQDISTIVPDDSEENSIKSEENLGEEREKPSVMEASMTDASGGDSTNKCEDKTEGEEHTGAELFEGKKDMEDTFLKEEEINVKLVESPQVDIEDIKTYVSDEGPKTTGVLEASEGDADNDESSIKYEVKTEDNVQKEDEMTDSQKNPESVLLEAAQIEKPIESLQETLPSTGPLGFLDDKTEEKTIDAIEKDQEILELQNVAITVSDEKIEGNSLIQKDGSQIQHEEYSEKEGDIPSVIDASTKRANDEELIIIHEGNIEHDDLRKDELLESKKDVEIDLPKDKAQIEKPVKSMQVATDIIESDSYHGMETPSSQEEQTVNENETMHEQREVETLDTTDAKKETPEAQNFATILSDENIKENSWIQEDGLELQHEELLEKESKAPSLSETLTMEANKEETTNIHQDKIEDEKLEEVDKFECDKHEEVTLLNQEAPVEKLNESSQEDLEDINDFVSGADTTEKSLIEVQSLNENPREIVGDQMEENIVDKDPEEIEDEHLDKDVTFENETHTEIGFTKKEEPMEKLQEPEKKDLEDIAFVSHERTDTTSSIEEKELTEISQESVGDPLEDTILAKAREIPDFTPIVSDEHAEKNSPIQPYGSQLKHEELSETETSFLNSSNNEPTAVHKEKIENEHLNKVDIAITNEEASVEELQESSKRDLKEVEDTISIDEQGLTEISQETVGDQLEKTLDKVGTPMEFTNMVSDVNGEDISLIPVDGSQIKHEELLEKESETPPLSFLNSSNEKLIEHEIPKNADKSEYVEYGYATLLNEEASAEKLLDSSNDLEDIKESITCEYTEITSSMQEQNLTKISQAVVDDQVEEKVLNVAREVSDFTTIIPDSNTDRNLLVEVDGSQIKDEEHLDKENEMPSLLMSNTSTGETTFVHEDKITEHAEIILSNEEALENSSKEGKENIKASVSCEDTETSSIDQQSLIANPHEIVGDQIKEKIIDIAQDAPDLTTITSEENAEENSLIQLDGSQIKHMESLEKESETPSWSMLNTTTEEPAIVQDCRVDDEDLRKVYEFEPEINTEAISLKEPTPPAEKVIESTKEDLGDTKVFPSCEDKETSSTEERSQKANQQETVVDQTKENILHSATKAHEFKQTVSHENAGENSLIQVDESQVKYETVRDPPQENVHDTAPEDQDFKQTVSHENAGENSLIQVDESQVNYETVRDPPQENVHDTAPEDQDFEPAISDENSEEHAWIQVDELQKKHDELEKDNEQSFLLVDTSNKEPRIIYEDITEDENLKKVHDFECEKHEEITSTEEEAQVRKVNESSIKDLQDIKELVSGEDIETTSLKENTQEILRDQQEEKILDIIPEAQNFIKVVSNENIEKDSLIHEDGSQMAHEEILEEGETPSLSAAWMLNTTDDDSKVIHERKIENEDLRKVDIFECEKHVDDKILDAAPEAPEFKLSDESTEEKSLDQYDKSQVKHKEILEKESKTLFLSETSLLISSNEDSTTIHDDKIEDEDPDKVDKLECEKHTEFPLTEKEAPSSVEDPNLQTKPQEVVGDQMEESIIDTTPEIQTFTTIDSDENTKENLSLDVDELPIQHEDLLENESEKPSFFSLKSSNEESSFICDSKTENEDVKRDQKLECVGDIQITESKDESSVEKLDDYPNGGLELIKVSVFSEDREITGPLEERSLSENPQENLTKDKIPGVVPEAPEVKLLDENTEEKSLDQYDKSQVKHKELLEKEIKTLSLSETSLLISSNKDSTTIHDDKIEDEDPDKVDKLECEKHTECPLTEEEAPSSVEDPNLQTKPQEVVGDQMEENIIDTTPEIQNFTTIDSDENTKENLSLDVDELPISHEGLSENESVNPSLLSLKSSNEESSFICDSKTENEDVKRDEKLECVGDVQINESKDESSVEKLDDYPNGGPESIKVSVSSEDKEITGPLEERSLSENPQENVTKDNIPDVAPEAPELKTIVSDKNIEENSIILEDGSKMKNEERSEKESEMPSLMGTSILNIRNDEPALLLDDKIENEEQAKVNKSECEKHAEITEVPMGNLNSSNLENIKAFVSCGDIETTNSTEQQNLTVNPTENLGGQNVEKVLDKALEVKDFTPIVPHYNNEGNSLIQVDESQMKHEEPLEEERKLPSLLETLLLTTNSEESATRHKDKIEDEPLKNVDEFESEKNSEINKLEEEVQVEESMAYKDIKENVSFQGTDTEVSALQEQILTANPQDILGNKSGDQVIDTADSKEKITENLTVSKENVVQDSVIQMDESEVKHEESLEKESEIPYLTKTSTVEANKESTIIHEDMIEEESGKIVESTLLKEESQANESVESLQVASEDIKSSVSCQNSDTTSSIQNADPQEIAGDQTDGKINIAGTREITTEAFNLTTLVSKENEVQDSFTPQDGLGIKHEDISEKESEVQLLTKTSMLADNDKELMIIQEDTIGGEGPKKFDTFKSAKQTENTLLKEEAHVDESMESLQVASEHTKSSVSCQDTDPTSSLNERILTTTPQETTGDQVEEKVINTAKAREKTPEVTSSIFVSQEDEANRTGADGINSGMTKDEETLNRGTASNAAENVEICASDKVQAKEEENEIISERKSDKEADKDDSWIKLTEDEGNQVQLTKLHESPLLSHAKDSEQEITQKRGTDNLQSGSDIIDDIDVEELDEGFVAISNKGNFFEANSNQDIETDVTTGEKEASAIHKDPVSNFVVQEIQEQQGKTVENVSVEKGIKSEEGKIKYDDSDYLINSSILETDRVAPSDIVCGSRSDAGQRAVDQETHIVLQEEEQKPRKAIEATPEEKGINVEGDEIKEHELTFFKAEQTDNAVNFDSSVGSNKIPVLQHGDSSESSQTDGEKQKTLKLEKGEKCENEETTKTMETSESSETNKPSLSGLLQESVKEVLKIVDHLVDKKEPTTHKEELPTEKSDEADHFEVKIDEQRDNEEESGEHQISNLSSDTPIMVDAGDRDVKVAHKKSHNILSGVGSKVKHSISKVKKAITGKSSHPKSASPKYSEKI